MGSPTQGQGSCGVTETTITPERPLVVEEGEARPGFIGQNVPRKEDRRLVQGEGFFFDDMKRHEMGFVHFVRSPYAHARIKSVDVAKALELDGVYGTLTGDEVAILTDPFFELLTPPGAHIKDYALAVGKVRHVGDPVAAVVARTRELARDAAELVEVEYEPLPPVLDGERALEDEVVLHDDAGSNTVWSGVFDWGDFDAALAEADHVVRIERLHFDRFSSTPLECSGCLVEYNRGTGQWTIHGNHQMPGVGAIWMAPALRVGIDKLRFVSQDIGGGFGNKITLHPQYPVCCLLARKLNRPVQWTGWGRDQHTANTHGNERTFLDVTVPVKADGTMLGFSVRAIDDCGAFPRYEPLGCIIWAQVDARLRDEQLRPVDDPESGVAVLRQQRGRHRQARHLRRGRRDARHRSAGPGARDDDGPGRRRDPRLHARRRERPGRARLVLELDGRLFGDLRLAVRGHRARRRERRDGEARRRDEAAGGCGLRLLP